MAWLALHQSLRKHPKLIHLASLVGVPDKDTVRAKLENLWLEALDYCLSGRLAVAERSLGAAEIADWSGWSGDPTVWLRSLIEAGWIDEKAGGVGGKSLYLHDWEDYAGKLIAKREADRERKPKKGVHRNSSGRPLDAERTNQPLPTVTNQPTGDGEEAPPPPISAPPVTPDPETREVDRTVAAFAFCVGPGIRAKTVAIADLRRQDISHEAIRAVAAKQEQKDFYDIIRSIQKGKTSPEFRPSAPAKPRCKNQKCVDGKVVDHERTTAERTAFKPCPDCRSPDAKATG